jgi:SAM-dependent methyltransferase
MVKIPESQKDYDSWVINTPGHIQDQYCGGEFFSPNESYFLETYAISTLLEIGCGTGHRTFPQYIRKGLDFFGVEKFQNLIDQSKYKKHLVLGKLEDPDFPKSSFFAGKKFDIVCLFGGVIDAFIDEGCRLSAWSNLKAILQMNTDYFLVDTLSHFDWFKQEQNGRSLRLYPFLPLQYFYSEKEIQNLVKINGMRIAETRAESIGHLQRTHYLLSRAG